eukprot:5486082-Pleurochrysis_carterae.AAC.1
MEQRLPPPCRMQSSLLSRAARSQLSMRHRRPPPCALHRCENPCAVLLHPSVKHLRVGSLSLPFEIALVKNSR